MTTRREFLGAAAAVAALPSAPTELQVGGEWEDDR
ncbi:MAG: twin-arginine translocation signal domain-containing protein [Halobacterium sp.]